MFTIQEQISKNNHNNHNYTCTCYYINVLFVYRQFLYSLRVFFLFFFNDTATTEIYTLSLHDALPILTLSARPSLIPGLNRCPSVETADRKSTRLNSSHDQISYAVFCLKKKKKIK